jgi:hypothetical protein
VNKKEAGWIDVGELMPRVSVHQIAAYFRFDLGETFGSSGEQRTRCPVTSCDGHDDFRSVSINVDDHKGPWKCHRAGYGCGAQGDKLVFIHCLETGSMPHGKLTGQEFLHAAKRLQEIAGGATPLKQAPPPAPKTSTTKPVVDDEPNKPLAESENESIRRLVTLDDQFTVNPGEMTPTTSTRAR